MPKELIAGVSFSDTMAQTVVLGLDENSIELYHLEESPNANRNDTWFLDSVLNAQEGMGGKISRVAVAIDNAAVFLLSFPLDGSLTRPEQNEHIQWELSNFVEDFKPKDYINDIHVLRTRAREQVSEILTVSVRRSLVFNIQNTLANKKIDLQLVDTNHFGAQHALFAVHPEAKTKVAALAGISKSRIDVGILVNGRLTNYRYALKSSIKDVSDFLEHYLKENSSSEVFLYGSGVSFELTKAFRSMPGTTVTTLNPFRKVRVSSSFRGFDKFIGYEHRFASCVGCALRK